MENTFTRNFDKNAHFRWKGKEKPDGTDDHNSPLPVEGIVTIETFYLKVPILEYSSEAKFNLVNDLFNNSYFFELKKWQCIQHMKISGKSLSFDITNIYRNVQNPMWAFIVFQTNQSNDEQKDNNTYYHVNVRNLWSDLGGESYPEESLKFYWEDNCYCMAYAAFLDFKIFCI